MQTLRKFGLVVALISTVSAIAASVATAASGAPSAPLRTIADSQLQALTRTDGDADVRPTTSPGWVTFNRRNRGTVRPALT